MAFNVTPRTHRELFYQELSDASRSWVPGYISDDKGDHQILQIQSLPDNIRCAGAVRGAKGTQASHTPNPHSLRLGQKPSVHLVGTRRNKCPWKNSSGPEGTGKLSTCFLAATPCALGDASFSADSQGHGWHTLAITCSPYLCSKASGNLLPLRFHLLRPDFPILPSFLLSGLVFESVFFVCSEWLFAICSTTRFIFSVALCSCLPQVILMLKLETRSLALLSSPRGV